jgi:hypothetical protein
MCLGHKEIQRKVQMNTKLVFEEFFERFWLGFFHFYVRDHFMVQCETES